MNDHGSPLVENAPRLPISIAARVAWSSIKVRMSRSLVTVSSVVLAVAFLLVVVGGDISERAVYGSFASDDRPNADVRAIYEVLSQPRSDLELLELIAERTDIAAWAAGYDVDLPDYDATDAQRALVLADWLRDLKATDRFKALENRSLEDWLLAFDQPGAADRFLSRAETFRGVRLPMESRHIQSLATSVTGLRAAVEALRRAERARLERVASAGGVDGVLDAIRTDQLPKDATGSAGLPLEQVIDPVDADRWRAIRDQLAILERRSQAREVIEAVNRMMPEMSKLGLAQLRDGEIASRADAFASDHGSLMDHIRSDMLRADTTASLEAVVERSPEITAIEDEDERAEAVGQILQSPGLQAAIADARLEAALSQEDIDGLVGELRERQRLDAINETLKAGGFDPDDDGKRTFWLLVLSLLVCIVGIVNSMMMAVTERFREIATMKCLGAMDGFILKAFLIESSSVGVVGALLGSILGLIIVLFQASATYGTTFWGALPADALALAAAASLGCGILLTIIGALLPAYKAARMHPIEAMRLET